MIKEILNYKIDRKIGEGGMGTVYLASNPALGQQVAIKMLHPKLAANPLLREKFRQEAILLSGLTHPNIVKFINYVDNEEGVFLIMEYVDGITLEDFIHKKNGLIVEDRAKPMLRELIDAFHHAHVQGIVHRDIKPSNILIDKDGHVKVLDFGIAKIMSEVGDDIARGSGSPMYMSPEQVLGKPLDARSDIYSLGVVMYEILTGRRPYDPSLPPMEIKHRVVNEALPRMKDAYAYISDEAQKIVDKATRKNPAERFASSGQMLQSLRSGKVADGGGGGGGSRGGTVSDVPGMPMPSGGTVRNDLSGGSQWWLWVIIGFIAAAAAVGGILWWKPWENQTSRQKAEEETLLGDDDALLIDDDGEEDDDDILLGANPTITLPAKSEPISSSKEATGKTKGSKKGAAAAQPAAPKNGMKPDKDATPKAMKPETPIKSQKEARPPHLESNGSGHDLKPKSSNGGSLIDKGAKE